MDAALTRNMIETARQIRERTGGFWTDQLNNADQLSAYRAMGDEIWQQTEGRIDAFVQSVGTAASVRGVAESLRDKRSDIQIVAVEPSESAVLVRAPNRRAQDRGNRRRLCRAVVGSERDRRDRDRLD